MAVTAHRGSPDFSECFESLKRQIQIKNLAGLGIAGERRRGFLAALGAELVRLQTPAIEVLDELLAVNGGRNVPPLAEAEVEQVVAAILRQEIQWLHRSGSGAVLP